MEAKDVAIIGAGPIGLELAVALKGAGVKYVHFDAGQIGQTISRYPRQTRFFSSPDRIAIAGVPLHTSDQVKPTGEEYLTYLRNILAQFDLKVRTYERVTAIKRLATSFHLQTERHGESSEYEARNVVLAVGDMAHPRLLHIPGEDMGHVSHYFEEPHRYFRQRLLIVGGKNSAVEAAIRCQRAGAQVSLSYRNDQFDSKRVKYWLLPELEALIQAKKITFYPNTVPSSITPTQVRLDPAPGTIGDPVTVGADFVLLLTGYMMDTTLFRQVDVELEGENQAPVHDRATMQTNVPGVYVAGTAAAGTQTTFRLFIENCHAHVGKILAAITGESPPDDANEPATDTGTLES